MKREHTLRRRLRSLETMSEAVTAMKSLSAHHLRTARGALPAARTYLEEVERALAAVDLPAQHAAGQPAALLAVAADLGLCDGYNSRLTQAALAEHAELKPARVYCIGRRMQNGLKRSGIDIERPYRAPSSVAGLTELLLRLAQDLLEDYFAGRFATLVVVAARFEGVGQFTPVSTRLLPIDLPSTATELQPSPYVSRERLAAVALREYLYIRLFQTLLDALAAEHGARLVATESAGEWLSERIAQTEQQLSAIRREAATQEVLDLASGTRRLVD